MSQGHTLLERAASERSAADQRDFERAKVAEHYEHDPEIFSLVLDSQLAYSTGIFLAPDEDLETAQQRKFAHIRALLRLKPGETFLDIGCGWGGLLCYAAEKYGVRAHGITLSDAQLEVAHQRIRERGLEDRVTAEIKDYADLSGSFDKIASIGMYEHIGLANIPLYLSKVKSLLSPKGLFLNHAISQRAKKSRRRFATRPEQRAIIKYIFPGGQLDDIGATVRAMEIQGFEVHDVEAWRPHYALTTRHWCERLTARRKEAERLVGEETYRIWVAYLAGCSLSFARGSLRIYQTLASRTSKSQVLVPLTRADLYT